MKKYYSLLLVLALLLPVLAGCQSSAPAADSPDPVQTSSTTGETKITETTSPIQPTANTKTLTLEEAINIALKDAGLTRDQVYDLDAELDRDNGVLHYDVDFEKDNRDYDYEIHAENGEILRKDIPVQAAATESRQLTREEARDITLKHAGFTADQVKFLETELDRDDGVLHYDVNFEKDGYDYDYEIDAASGKILKAEKERD